MVLLLFYSTYYYYFFVPFIFCVLWYLLQQRKNRINDRIILGLLFALPVIIRLPYLIVNAEMDIDESGVIGQALSLKNGGFMWRDINPSTAGPINTFVYYLFCTLFRLPFNYITVHVLALLVDLTTLLFLFKSGKELFDARKSSFSLLFVILILHLNISDTELKTTLHPFFHYSSEKISLMVISILLFLTTRIYVQKQVSITQIFIIGLLTGFAPFTKPQGAIISSFISLYALYLTYTFGNGITKKMLLYALGGFIFPVFIACYLYCIDGWTIFLSQFKLIQDYGNLKMNFLSKVFLFNYSPVTFRNNSIGTLFTMLLIAFIYYYKKNISVIPRFYFFLIILSVITVYSIIKPGTFYGHYYQYLLPLIFYFSFYKNTQIINFAFLLILLMNYIGMDRTYSRFNDFSSIKTNFVIKKDHLSDIINTYKQDTDKLAVWGWATSYFVETQLPQATSQNHVPYVVESAAFQKEYIDEVIRNKPAFFLDATGRGFMVRQKYEAILPALIPFINQNYTLIKTYEGDRLFIRKDRLAYSGKNHKTPDPLP